VQVGELVVVYMPTIIQQANLLTKPLGITQFKELTKLVGLVNFSTLTIFHDQDKYKIQKIIFTFNLQ
jgi:hypothetical protein